MGRRSWVAVAAGCLVAPVLTAFPAAASTLPVDGRPPAARAFPGEAGRIAFGTDRHDNDEGWKMAPDGSDLTRVTYSSQDNGAPTCSPDSSLLAMGISEDDVTSIAVMERTRDFRNLVTRFDDVDLDPRWSPDSQVDLEIRQPTLRVLPGVAPPGKVVLAYGEDMPPHTRVSLAWSSGITIHDGPFRVSATGTVRVPMLVVRHDLLGTRLLEASSVRDLFTPVVGELLVVPRTLTPPNFHGRG